jgi:hypothetical protein
MRAQASIMEYILMTFFLLVVIISMILFMGWWNVTQISIDQSKLAGSSALLLLQVLSNSEYIAEENSVLDDSRLTAIKAMQSEGVDFCSEFEPVFGRDSFFEVHVLDGNPEVECSFSSHPECNTWTFCKPDQSRSKTTYNIPVNVHRKISGRNDIAILYAGVYR